MDITKITTMAGSKPKRKRVGRGESSGLGKTCGRGNKGAGARAGCRSGNLYEGGMFPLFRRLPKFGFSNTQFHTEYQVVNVGDLEDRFQTATRVTAAALKDAGLITDSDVRVKVLGNGELKKKLVVEAHRFSASAISKIEAAGGTVTKLGPQPKKKFVRRRERPEVSGEAGSAKGGKSKKAEKKGDKGAEPAPPSE
jgi:large subunit ribosomal protein L15